MTSSQPKRRIIVVGATFGEWYLNAFMQIDAPLELAGLMSTGSERSRQLAHDFGIPLYTDIQALPDDIDIACIVVSSTVAGGAGTRLAEAFLSRGVHVIQEHPVHPDEVSALQQRAAQHQCHYWVSSLYPHVPAGRCWVSEARQISERLQEPARFIRLTTSRQLLYSTLDMLLSAQPIDAEAVDIVLIDTDADFHLLRYRWPTGTATLWLQRYQDPTSPDMHSLVMHHQQIGWTEGYLTLNASYGPVIWSSTLHVNHPHDSTTTLYHRPEALNEIASQTRYAAPYQWRDCCESEGPAGIAHLLTQFDHALNADPTALATAATHQRAVARLWQRTLQCVGAAEDRHLEAPRYDALTPWTYAEEEHL
ncbi:Gfo/Idh/MocA family oxidoreductase [Zymobacter palmae]|uniref:Oxidoreductase n=1 Tax=Zymobacter palmae TaxID=33074 RepID=A0A348HD72_9GAMM|nr:Gfo/Idh/MocA family oxidoreductase [Zymobacter palmae]BBG29574.1 oxidoreductase [Zymobacter palmae]